MSEYNRSITITSNQLQTSLMNRNNYHTMTAISSDILRSIYRDLIDRENFEVVFNTDAFANIFM